MGDAELAEDQFEEDPLSVCARYDDHVKGLSVLVAAAQALNWSRQGLRDIMSRNEFQLVIHNSGEGFYEKAQMDVYSALSHLTYTRTYWTIRALENIDTWCCGNWFKYGVKDKIPYKKKSYLLTLSCVDNGQPLEWKMDFQGSASFPVTMEGEAGAETVLREVQQRIDDYHRYLDSSTRPGQDKRRRVSADDSFHRGGDPDLESMKHFVRVSGMIRRYLASGAQDRKAEFRDTRGAVSDRPGTSLTGLLWSDLEPTVHPPDMDADVSYNPDQRVEYTARGGDVHVQVYRQYAARRQWGVHYELENNTTIQFINRMLPKVGSGWYDINLTQDKRSYHVKLTPWQEPKTTYVQPFMFKARQSHMPEIIRGDSIITPEFVRKFGEEPDVRKFKTSDFEVVVPEPYLITGKGNEIDGIVQSLRVFDRSDHAKLKAFCEVFLEVMLQQPEASRIATLISRVRAYYSTDTSTTWGNLCSFGDRSVFFFNLMGWVVGVEMSSPSIQYVNQRAASDFRAVPARRARSVDGAGAARSVSRGRSASRGRAALPPPPPAQIPQNLQKDIDGMKDLIHKLVETVGKNAGGRSDDGDSKMQELLHRLNDMEDQLEQQRTRKDEDSSDDEDKNLQVLSYARQAVAKRDFADGWSMAVDSDKAYSLPEKVSVWGIPDLFKAGKDDKVVGENEALEFVIDQRTYLMKGGAIVYECKKEGGNHWLLIPQSEDEQGVLDPVYCWTIVYMTGEAGLMKLEKKLHKNVLIAEGMWSTDWRPSTPLVTVMGGGILSYKVCVRIPPLVQQRRRQIDWKQKMKNYSVSVNIDRINKKYEVEYLQKTNFYPKDLMFPAIAGDKVNLSIFRPFSPMPYNDRSGQLPGQIQMVMKRARFKNYAASLDRSIDELSVTFDLTDSSIPEYTGTLRDKQYDKNIALYLTSFLYNGEGNPHEQKYVWGIKSDGGYLEDPMFVAIAFPIKKDKDNKITKRYKQALMEIETEAWSFMYTFDHLRINAFQMEELYFQYNPGTMVRRTSNWINPTHTDEQDEEMKGTYKPVMSRELVTMFDGIGPTKRDYIEKLILQLTRDNRLPKYGLPLYHHWYISWKSAKSHVKLEKNMAPKMIKMEHTWLNGEKAQQRGTTYSEKDYNLYLVDLQGPIYVSESGNFMIAPHLDTTGRYDRKAWGLYKWNTSFAAYKVFAVKSDYNKAGYLITEKNFIQERADSDPTGSVRGGNLWKLYQRWDGKTMTAQEIATQRAEQLTVSMVATRNPKNPNSGFSVHLFQRCPDYSVVSMDEMILNPNMVGNIKQMEERVAKREAKEKEMKEKREQERKEAQALKTGKGRKGLSVEFLGAKKTNKKPSLNTGKGKLMHSDDDGDEEDEETYYDQEENGAAEQGGEGAAQAGAAQAEQAGAAQAEQAQAAQAEQPQAEQQQQVTQENTQPDEKEQAPAESDAAAKTEQEAEMEKQKMIGRLHGGVKKALENRTLEFTIPYSTAVFKGKYEQNPSSSKETAELKIRENFLKAAKHTAEELRAKITSLDDTAVQKVIEDEVNRATQDAMSRLQQVWDKYMQQKEKIQRNQEAELKRNKQREQEDALVYENKPNMVPFDESTFSARRDENGDDEFEHSEQQKVEVDEHDEKRFVTIQLVDGPIQQNTPWSDIMSMYKGFLIQHQAKIDVNAEKRREQELRNNALHMEEQKKKEDEEKERVRKLEEEKRRKAEEKTRAEESFADTWLHIKPAAGSDEYDIWHQCKVLMDTGDDFVLPLTIKEDLKLFDKNVNVTFTLNNPWKMTYLFNDMDLRLQPSLVTDVSGKSFYAWTLYVNKYPREQDEDNPWVKLAVKWNEPQVLESTSPQGLDWTWRVSKLKKINWGKPIMTAKGEQHYQALEEEAASGIVHYAAWNLPNTKKWVSENKVPVFKVSGEHTEVVTHKLNQTMESLDLDTILQGVPIAYPLTQIKENFSRFFEFPTVIMVSFPVGKGQKVLDIPFKIKKTDRDEVVNIYWENAILNRDGPRGQRGFTIRIRPTTAYDNWELVLMSKVAGLDLHEGIITLATKRSSCLLDGDAQWHAAPNNSGKKQIQDERTRMFAELRLTADTNVNITLCDTQTFPQIVKDPDDYTKNLETKLYVRNSAKEFIANKPGIPSGGEQRYLAASAEELTPLQHAEDVAFLSSVFSLHSAEARRGSGPAVWLTASPEEPASRPAWVVGERASPGSNEAALLPLQPRRQCGRPRPQLKVQLAPPVRCREPRQLPLLNRAPAR